MKVNQKKLRPAVTLLIPNYNGRKLLAENLPAVLKSLRSGDELCVVDDASTDQSWSWLCAEFALPEAAPQLKRDARGAFTVMRGRLRRAGKDLSVVLIRNQANLRFAASCNRGVEQLQHELVFLLNSDVSPHASAIDRLAHHFIDENVFAVGCLEEEGGVQGGRNELWFSRGRFHHRRAPVMKSGSTAWVSGGSGMFRVAMWRALGGFDEDYAPAYWEDVDLSFRARRAGWRVLFEEAAVVVHHHESTNKDVFGLKHMERMSWRHGLLFTWKNATWWQRLQMLCWQPYWWVREPAPSWLGVMAVMMVIGAAVGTRMWNLQQVPPGFAWDEAAIGYNGFAIWNTRRDEWLIRLPLSFRSFGDYKAPLAIYLSGAVTAVLGLSVWAVRSPFAVAGIFGVIGAMLLGWQLGKDTVPLPRRTIMAVLAGMWFVFSPPALHFSRIAFESGLSLSFLIWGMAAWIAFCRHRRNVWTPPWSFWRDEIILVGAAVVWLCASMYSYHSAKLVVPFLVATSTVIWWRSIWQKKLPLVVAGLGFVAGVFPLLRDALVGSGGERFTQASVFGLELSTVEKIQAVGNHFARHFWPDFLVQGATISFRHGDGRWGFLLLPVLCLALIGLAGGVLSFWQHSQNSSEKRRWWLLAVMWILIGAIPAAIGRDVPHANRALLELPGWLLLSLLGGIDIALWIKASRFSLRASHGEKDLLVKWIFGSTVLFSLLLGVAMIRDYFVRFPVIAVADFQDGYIHAFAIARQHEPSVDKILFTSAYGQPYIYALFVRQTNPIWYQGGSLIKYEFSDRITIGDFGRPNTLIIGTPEELPLDRIPSILESKVIKGADGSVRFVVVRTPATSAAPSLLGGSDEDQ